MAKMNKGPSTHKQFYNWYSGAQGFSKGVEVRRNVVHPKDNRLSMSWVGKNFCFRVRLFRDKQMNDEIRDIVRFLDGVKFDLEKLQELITKYKHSLVDVNSKAIKELFVETDAGRLQEIDNLCTFEVIQKQIDNPV